MWGNIPRPSNVNLSPHSMYEGSLTLDLKLLIQPKLLLLRCIYNHRRVDCVICLANR